MSRDSREKRQYKTRNYLRQSWMLYLMLLLPLAYFILFKYVPMTNIVIAFKDYNMFIGTWESPWAGLKWFIKAFSSRDFFNAVRNTFVLNILDLIVGFPAPVILAILLNELAFKKYKRITQTIVYLPYFLSWIIIVSMAKELLGPRTGVINILLGKLGIEPINFLMENNLWIGTYVGLGLWKNVGWNTVIYLAAITTINPELYEAAEVDGASRMRKIWHITLPGLRPTIVVLLIIGLGHILGSEFDRPYALGNGLVRSVADVISTLVYRVGIRSFQFSYTAAIGLFQSVICVLFLIAANMIAKRFGERGIW